MSDILTLAGDFPVAEEAEWRERVAKALKGKSFDSLVWRSADGFDVQPLYEPRNDVSPLGARSEAGWQIAQRVDIPRMADANEQALQDLEGGASALTLVMPDSVNAGGHGLPLGNLDDLKRLTERVELELIGLRLDAGRHALWLPQLILTLYKSRNLDLGKCDLRLCIDPVGRFALGGTMPGVEFIWDQMTRKFIQAREAGLPGQLFAADDRVYHMAGATPGQELGIVLATTVEYLRALESQGISLADAARSVSLVVSTTADLFMSVAKLRAARLVWARLMDAMGPGSNRPLHRCRNFHADDEPAGCPR